MKRCIVESLFADYEVMEFLFYVVTLLVIGISTSKSFGILSRI